MLDLSNCLNGVRGTSWNWFSSYLDSRSQLVMWQGSVPVVVPIVVSVPVVVPVVVSVVGGASSCTSASGGASGYQCQW